LSGNEKLRELGMAFMKLDMISRKLTDKIESLLVIFKFVPGETDQKLDVAPFRN
jgi:hypothetical protein